MINLRSNLTSTADMVSDTIPLNFHPSFFKVHEKVKKWMDRFPFAVDSSIFSDLALLYLLAAKKYLDHRKPVHLYRLVLAMNVMQKKIMRQTTFSPHVRHLEICWIATKLTFPFAHKPVLGCLIGFNLMDRYEVFDEENVILALKKHLPQLKFVKDSSYCHTSQHKNLKIFYFEVEKSDGTPFSLTEQTLLKTSLEQKVTRSIQSLSPTIFMGLNDEEVYKNILVLSQEIHSLHDLPQAYITFDQQTGKEIIFRVNLVHISPFHRFSLKERFFESTFVAEKVLTVRHLENHPIQAHIFRLHLPREVSLLRSDGSLDFYRARQKVVSLISNAIGEFRDYSGGILIKQQELLQSLKEAFSEISSRDSELLESFFYALMPLDKQATMQLESLTTMFNFFLEGKGERLAKNSLYSFKMYQNEHDIYLFLHSDDLTLSSTISTLLQDNVFSTIDIAYNLIDSKEGLFFNCLLTRRENKEVQKLIQDLQEAVKKNHYRNSERQVLRIGFENLAVSLDPRIGGEGASGDILRLLFEGLTRFDLNGNIENAVAEKVEVSSNMREYTFRLRQCYWNDGSLVSAYDFEYAWKKILSPRFKTAFAFFFYPIKNAKEAKQGNVSLDEIGITVVDDRTLKVELVRPDAHFLHWTAHTIYSPVHRVMDVQHPQWPYQTEMHYPCNGPFQLKMNQPNQGLQLVKNLMYWDANAISWDQVTLTKVAPSQALQAFKNKEIDWIGNPFGVWDESYVAGVDDRELTFPNSWVCNCVFNTTSLPFSNRKLRQAIAYTINRSQFINETSLSLNPAFSPLLPYFLKTHHTFFPDVDKEKAKQLWEEGLEELKIEKKSLPFTFIAHEKGLQKMTALRLREQFKEYLGIDCEIKLFPWDTLFNKLIKRDFQMGLSLWNSWVPDPIYTLNIFKSADQELNFSNWENESYQKCLELSEKQINPFLSSSYLRQAEEILVKEMPIVPLFYVPYRAMVKKSFNVHFRMPCGPFNVARTFKTPRDKNLENTQ